MPNPVQVTFHEIDHSDAVEARIREKAEELDRHFDRISQCHVTVEAPKKKGREGHLYSVHIDLHVPGRQIVVSRDREDPAHEDVYIAIRDAFKAAKRQLDTYVGKLRSHQ